MIRVYHPAALACAVTGHGQGACNGGVAPRRLAAWLMFPSAAMGHFLAQPNPRTPVVATSKITGGERTRCPARAPALRLVRAGTRGNVLFRHSPSRCRVVPKCGTAKNWCWINISKRQRSV